MKNKVELLGMYGDDTTIACSAWTSTSRNLTEEKKARIPNLINKLWKDGHKTPFEKGTVHFLVDTDIATHIHLLKHRIASINAESARYKELKEDKFIVPVDWICKINNKEVKVLEYWVSELIRLSNETNERYHKCLKDLEPILGRKRAKESARFFKMYNSQIQSDVMFNMSSFANFLRLRTAKDAQLEIRQVATEMYNIVKKDGRFKETLKAFNLDI